MKNDKLLATNSENKQIKISASKSLEYMRVCSISLFFSRSWPYIGLHVSMLHWVSFYKTYCDLVSFKLVTQFNLASYFHIMNERMNPIPIPIRLHADVDLHANSSTSLSSKILSPDVLSSEH